MPKQTIKNKVVPLVATFLAWLVPGAGHVYLGKVRRGVILFVTISATFWAGIAVGGVMTLDPQNERWWFVAQMFTGVHGLVGWRRQDAAHEAYLAELRDDSKFRSETEMLRDELLSVRSGARRRMLLERLAAHRRVYLDAYQARDGVALVAPGDTIARAYAGVAGLLNLICVFDAMMLALMGKVGEPSSGSQPAPARRGREDDAEGDAP